MITELDPDVDPSLGPRFGITVAFADDRAVLRGG
jgi:hypothetical protein